ncbi:unnamed protein product [Effrenium voratum]|nr:unnamed protein product [Effrenium voratum]
MQTLQLGPFEAGASCEILRAWYGVASDPKRQVDATLHCRNAYSNATGLTLRRGDYYKLFGDPAPLRIKKMSVEYRLGNVKTWDVSTTRYDNSLSMVPVMCAKAFSNVLGVSVAASGYAVGKALVSLQNFAADADSSQGVADSTIFQTAFSTWLRCNGIFPSVTYDPIPGSSSSSEDMRLTPIIVSNHVCYLDGMVLASVFHSPKIIAMKGTLNVPVIGLFAKDIGVIEVDRSDPKSRAATIKAIEDHVAGWKPQRQPLLLFPEGTTSNGQGLLEFKKGAFVPGVPVRPAVLCYTGSWDPANTSYRTTGDGKLEAIGDAEWAGQFLGHAFHSLQIRVLPPYHPSEAEKQDPLLYAANVHKAMTRAHAELRQEVSKKAVEARQHSIQAYAQKGVGAVEDAWNKVTTSANALLCNNSQAETGHEQFQRTTRTTRSPGLSARVSQNQARRQSKNAESSQQPGK